MVSVGHRVSYLRQDIAWKKKVSITAVLSSLSVTNFVKFWEEIKIWKCHAISLEVDSAHNRLLLHQYCVGIKYWEKCQKESVCYQKSTLKYVQLNIFVLRSHATR